MSFYDSVIKQNYLSSKDDFFFSPYLLLKQDSNCLCVTSVK